MQRSLRWESIRKRMVLLSLKGLRPCASVSYFISTDAEILLHSTVCKRHAAHIFSRVFWVVVKVCSTECVDGIIKVLEWMDTLWR